MLWHCYGPANFTTALNLSSARRKLTPTTGNSGASFTARFGVVTLLFNRRGQIASENRSAFRNSSINFGYQNSPIRLEMSVNRICRLTAF